MTDADRPRAEFATGVLYASLAAGPIFNTVVLLPPAIEEHDVFALVVAPIAALGLFILSVPIGFLLALIPNMIGGALLAWAGAYLPAARSWGVYAISGGLLGCLLAAFAEGIVADSSVDASILLLGATGTACALICRHKTRWHD